MNKKEKCESRDIKKHDYDFLLSPPLRGEFYSFKIIIIKAIIHHFSLFLLLSYNF